MEATSERQAAQSAIKKQKSTEKAARGPRTAGTRASGRSAGELKLYSEDAPGLQIGPTAVLLTCLIYIGAVVILHIVGKIRG